MTREEIEKQIVEVNNTSILCELPTGFGKSKIALEFLNSKLKDIPNQKILIVVPRLVLIDNWKDEFKKWGYESYLKYVEFVTYVSFPKKVGVYDMIIFDEAHHLSERCREAFTSYISTYNLLLSATVGRNIKYEIKYLFKDLRIFHVSARTAIQENILPDPKVILIPLSLNNSVPKFQIVKNPKAKGPVIRVPYAQRFKYLNIKNNKIILECTAAQYYDDITNLINWYKNKMGFNQVFKNMYLRKAGERLKWLSDQKTNFVKSLLSQLKDYRTLTFCNGIAQTEELGKYCINSKNKESDYYLSLFNANKIKHITACNILDEGVNLNSCKLGIYATLNSSERMITQKLGRLLRHQSPVIIIPYYVNTRDKEIVNKMLENYNPNLITTLKLTELNNLKELI